MRKNLKQVSLCGHVWSLQRVFIFLLFSVCPIPKTSWMFASPSSPHPEGVSLAINFYTLALGIDHGGMDPQGP